MTNKPSVAVVIPTYNSAHTIGAALASVAAQSVHPHEVIVVDDASHDHTIAETERWSDLLPLHVVSLPVNAGPAHARRRAIGMSSAPLIALLDSDDVWLPDHLSSLVAVHETPYDVATALPLRWVPGGGAAVRRHDRLPHDRSLRALIRSNFVFIGSMFTRSLYDTAGGFRDGFTSCEDWDLWIRMARAGARFVQPAFPTVIYRVASTSLSADDRDIDAAERLLRAFREELEGVDEEINAALEQLMARRALVQGYDAAREGRSAAARRHAIRVLQFGNRPLRLRGAVLAASPSLAAALRDSRKWTAPRMLRG